MQTGTVELWQRLSGSVNSGRVWERWGEDEPVKVRRAAPTLWVAADGLTIIAAVALATLYRLHTTPLAQLREVWNGTLFSGRSAAVMLALLGGFILTLIASSRRMHLYEPLRFSGYLREQQLSAQACFTSGLLLTGALYLLHAFEIPRSIVFMTIALVTVALGVRRLIYRAMLYRRFKLDIGTRNVLIVGTGPEVQALRYDLEKLRHLGYSLKGFVQLGSSRSGAHADDVVLDTLFQQTRKHFVDEIFFTAGCEREVVQRVLERAREQGVCLRIVPDLYGGLARNSPIEYIGPLPTIPLHSVQVPELRLVLKRAFDIVLSIGTLLALSPLLTAIAAAIKLDSPGPVFYPSERLGKKGRVFRMVKFRTMVENAERRKAELQHMNERDGVLFKVSNDPRITPLGRFLRKYSLDELPQFWNVLKGEMSVVGPRPPFASEVQQYKLDHLRRLDVMPGITGLWQVQGRQDPSFASYVSLDVRYVDNWSIWMDFQIILRTIVVVFAGTGS